jgi:hypothetical protein
MRKFLPLIMLFSLLGFATHSFAQTSFFDDFSGENSIINGKNFLIFN